MSRFRVLSAARADLDEIWLHVAVARSEDAANRLIDSILDRFPTLAQMPAAGRKREEIRVGLRSHPVGNYVIFYQQVKGRVEIVRVIHGSREVTKVFES